MGCKFSCIALVVGLVHHLWKSRGKKKWGWQICGTRNLSKPISIDVLHSGNNWFNFSLTVWSPLSHQNSFSGLQPWWKITFFLSTGGAAMQIPCRNGVRGWIWEPAGVRMLSQTTGRTSELSYGCVWEGPWQADPLERKQQKEWQQSCWKHDKLGKVLLWSSLTLYICCLSIFFMLAYLFKHGDTSPLFGCIFPCLLIADL